MSTRPEVLAPAGDLAALGAARAAGADAVYFGLDEGFNARARAANFSLEGLPETVARVHRAGARAYVTLNTVVFESELPAVERIVRAVAASGADALIVQDPAVALIARAVCPSLEVHASTQMTISSPEGAAFAETLGVTRVVVPRELSLEEIRRLAEGTRLELEVFVHGALCMSWSGQCLTSEAWGGRSANRGQCAQSCRMPYDLLVDGAHQPLGDVRYLLSPQDLAGVDHLAPLVALGVHGLKIEGRQKAAPYVASAVSAYRRQVDALAEGRRADTGEDRRAMSLTYSRGFSAGFLEGSDHQTLVEGRFPKHRGAYLGRVGAVEGDTVRVDLDPGGRPRTAEPRAGMGVVFDAGRPEEAEQGGPVFAAEAVGDAWRLRFGRPGPNLRRVDVGERVWLTGDPTLVRIGERLAESEAAGRVPLHLVASGREGEPLQVRARAGHGSAEVSSDARLTPARGAGLGPDLLRDKLGALGGTPFHLASFECDLPPGLHLPVSQLKATRRRLVATLQPAIERGAPREIDPSPALSRLGGAPRLTLWEAPTEPRLVPLCRTDAHLDAAIAAGLPEVELDWMELVGLRQAVEKARAAGMRITIATVRVQKPGEEGYDRRIAALEPDAVLARHWGAVMQFATGGARPAAVHGDFSLNVTNAVTARHLLDLGLDTLTVAHDLDATQLLALVDAAPAERLTVTVHHHIPTFHTEHCVYAHLLSDGRDFRDCGRPCERHQVELRDHTGHAHPVVVDVGCRNTVFNAQAQTAASLAPVLLERGVKRLRVELVRESREEAGAVLGAWSDLLAGRIGPRALIDRVGVHEQFGVTPGTMRVLR